MKIFQDGMFRRIIGLILSHIFAVSLGALFGFMSLSAIAEKPVAYAIYTAVVIVFYFSVIYKKAFKCAEYDKKTYTATSVYSFNGAVLSVGILLFNIALWVLYAFSWRYMTINGLIATGTGMIYNMLYVINTFIYSGIAEVSKGNVPLVVHFLTALVPLVASTIGYIAGVKGFTVADKLMPFVYEKKKD